MYKYCEIKAGFIFCIRSVALRTYTDSTMMRLVLLLCCLVAIEAKVPRSCEGPVINGTHYTNEILRSGLGASVYLRYDISTNSLYSTQYGTTRNVYKMDLDSKASERVEFGDLNVVSVSLDPRTNDIFLAAANGIYKYNKADGKSELYGASGSNIWQAYPRNNVLYFTTFTEGASESHVFKLVDGQVSRTEELKDTTVFSFIIDNDDYIVFQNKNGLFRQKLGSEEAVRYSSEGEGRDLAINNYGDVYAATMNGIYFVNTQTKKLDLIYAVDTEDCFSVAFDSKNNIIYSDAKTLHRLQPSENQECV